MQIRRFTADLKSKIPGGHQGLYGVPVQFDRPPDFSAADKQELAQRVNGLPILLNRPLTVTAMYLDPHSQMDEHSAGQPILFLVLRGSGFVRIGGLQGETAAVTSGDAVLWPAGLDHTVWTEADTLDALVIDGPAERQREPEAAPASDV